MPEGRCPRGVTPRPRSGAAAESTRLQGHRNGQEELPHVLGQGGGGPEEIPSVRGQGPRREELPRVRGQGRRLEGDTPRPNPEARGGGREELPHTPMPEAKGGGQEDQPHVQEAVAAWVQEGLEELSHVESQEGRW